MPRTRRGALWRFALASVLIIGLTAATTAVAGLLQIKAIVDVIDATPALKNIPTVLPAPGAPETLLLIGSDHRAGEPYTEANTDTMMLVRIDDSSQTINVLSIPRDLAVMLPSAGGEFEGKLNAAYSVGGVRLLLNTLKQQVFPKMKINHVLDVNFAGFSDMIDAIGCVYADVDHRYYNNTALTDYSTIDIEPGYQKLCGDDESPSGALAFVRFRHTDSDVVRNARQQDFLRWAKEGYSSGELLSNRGKLLSIFGHHVQTDHSLHTTDGIDELFDLVFNADTLTVKSITFPEYFGACGGGGETPCYVYPLGAGPQYSVPIGHPTPEEASAYRRFITPTKAPSPRTTTATTSTPTTSTPTKRRPKKGGKAHARPPALNTAGLTADVGDGRTQAAQLGNPGLPVYYPKFIVAGAYAGYCFSITANCDDLQEPAAEYNRSYPRRYELHTTTGKVAHAYVMTLEINAALGEYYTVQGMTWQDPPIFNSVKRVQVVAGKTLFEYLDGGRIALVAWHTPQAVYWISNTLANTIGNAQMIAMAASLTPAA